MKKVVMNLEDYKGSYAMHCPTEELAELFCGFLGENGRTWKTGRSYKEYTFWSVYENETVYYFNEGQYYCKKVSDRKILEIEDFIQEVEE